MIVLPVPIKAIMSQQFRQELFGSFDSKPLAVENCSVGLSLACRQLKRDGSVMKQCSQHSGMWASKQVTTSNDGAVPVAVPFGIYMEICGNTGITVFK